MASRPTVPPSRIACLAWGSLAWKPGPLRLASGWFADGPALPIEFCRVDDKSELSTALCDGVMPVNALWARLATHDLAEAREQLRVREGIPTGDVAFVGSVPGGVPGLAHVGTIAAWAAERELDAVVWTALPPRIDGENGRMPTAPQAVAYLDALEGEERQRAERYVRSVPRTIATAYRQAIERRLGWLPDA